jgi:hypothetical protein
MAEEKRCPVCGARMLPCNIREDGEITKKWICSAGVLCDFKPKKKESWREKSGAKSVKK